MADGLSTRSAARGPGEAATLRRVEPHAAATPRPDGPWRVTFVTNPDDCNLRCFMCDGHSELARLRDGRRGAPRRMDLGLVGAVLAERRGTGLAEAIPSTRGEPLLYPQLDGLLDLCAAHGVKVNLTTNGTFPGRGARSWGERLAPVCSDVKVSWAGATAPTAEAVMRGLRFGEARENVRAFAAARDAVAARGGGRCRLSFQVTAMEANVTELPAVVRLAASLGVERVKVNHVQVHFAQLAPQSLRRSPEAIRRWNAAVRASRQAAEESGRPGAPAVELQGFVELRADPADPAPRGPCPFLGREAWVEVDGRFSPCPARAAARGELGDFGSLRERALGEIWAAGPFRSLCAGHLSHPACAACRLRRPGGA